MGKKKDTNQETKSEPAKLLKSKEEARSKIQKRIDLGNELYGRTITTEDAFETLKREFGKYNKYNHYMLSKMFPNEPFAEEYSQLFDRTLYCNKEWEYLWNKEKKEILDKIDYLESILDRLELIDTIQTTNQSKQANAIDPNNKKVFVVHGRDNEPKEAVARFLGKLGLEPIILHEQTNEGETIIDKFKKNSDVGFAVILLTPDDKVHSDSSSDQFKYQARQNVIFEMGYFLGKLDRNKICILLKSKVELPSDILGVGYVQYNEDDAWKLQLAREIKKSGIKIDLNKLT